MTVIELATRRKIAERKPEDDLAPNKSGIIDQAAATKLVATADRIGSIACKFCIHATSLSPAEAVEFNRHFDRFKTEMEKVDDILERIIKNRGKK